jgi:hypothetical protein
MSNHRPSRPKSSIEVGTITGVQDHGTIVLVSLLTERGWTTPVFFDHRAFAWLLDGESCQPDDLVGRRASFDGAVLNLEQDDE